jgi:uncharacterized membrane protein (DUF4010 family)
MGGIDLQRTGLAVAIGLLIGIQRGWQERGLRDGMRVAGIRTFTLVGLLGGLCGLMAANSGAIVLGLTFLAFALPFGFFEWQRARAARSASVTDLVAGLVTFALGAYATTGRMSVAAAAGVLTAAILAGRRVMHTFLRHLTWKELRAALALLVMTAVLLPALPDRPVDPWGALNPYQIWLMTVLVGAVCYLGYVAVRIGGEGKGLMFAGVMGGIATSTTVTWTFARLVRRDDALMWKVLPAILAAWVVSLLRMTTLAAALAPRLLAPLAAPIGAAALVLALLAIAGYRKGAAQSEHRLVLQDPFELSLLLRFTVMMAAILLAAKFFSSPSGLVAVGAASGLLDVDPVTLSAAEMSNAGLPTSAAVMTILAAGASNILAKTVLGFAFGGRRVGLWLTGAALAAMSAAMVVRL